MEHTLEEPVFVNIDDPELNTRMLRVSQHGTEEGYLRLEILPGGGEDEEPESSIVVGEGELRGFLNWLKEGDS